MPLLEALIADLESPDAKIRNHAALDLMDRQAEAAIAPLIRAILKPENEHHRGTLVYALGAFDCEPCVELLIDLALTGNYEVSLGACSIIYDMTLAPETMQRIAAQLLKHDATALENAHNREVRQHLHALISAEARAQPII